MNLAMTNIAMRTHLLLALMLCAHSSSAETAAVRDMSTDRPDTTESPYTVPQGLFQVEMSFFDYSRDGDRGASVEDWIFGQVNFKIGVAENADLQFVFDTYTQSRSIDNGVRDRSSGFADVTVRYKHNLWGNDGGKTAFALMPYLTIPTETQLSSGEWEGGLIMPLGVELTDRIGLGLMAQVDYVHDSDTNGYDLEFLHSATLGFGLTEQLGLYLELVGIAGQDADYRALFDTGLTLAVTDTLVFDTGIRLGLNRAAPDFGVFTGVSFRF